MKRIEINKLPEQGVSHNARIRKREMIADGEVGPLTTYSRATFPPGEKAPAHFHNDLVEVFTVESGCGEIRIDDVAYVFPAGVTVVVEPGDIHEIINTGPSNLVVTYFGILLE